MENKYCVEEKIIVHDQKAQIVGTKENPYLQSKSGNPYNKERKIYPKNDYLVFYLKDEEKEEYLGMEDIYEHEIQNRGWL